MTLAATKYLPQPLRLLITGKCECGKTTLAVDLMKKIASRYDRMIVVCPSWFSQDIFRGLDYKVEKKRDVIEEPDKTTFDKILKEIRAQNKYAKEIGCPYPRTLVFVDDLSGNGALHGGRISPMANLSVNIRHLGGSMIVISHNPKFVAPGYRENINALIAFPNQTSKDLNWLFEEYNMNNYDKINFYKVVMTAWTGGTNSEDEIGKHFLFISMPPRSNAMFFCNFSHRITRGILNDVDKDKINENE